MVIRAHVARTGALIWEKEIEGASNFWAEEDALEVDGNFVFAAGMLEDWDVVVRAYEARSGDLRWSARIEVGEGRLSQGFPIATSNGRLFATGVFDCDPVLFVECKSFVHAFDASTGELLWRETNQSPGNDWQVNGLVAVGARVFVSGARLNEAGDYTAVIRAYDSKTGRLTWEDDFDGGGTAFDSVYDLFWDGGRLFALGVLSNPDKYSDFLVRAYGFEAHRFGDKD
jgi:outer membrane protein assembly factor BamB